MKVGFAPVAGIKQTGAILHTRVRQEIAGGLPHRFAWACPVSERKALVGLPERKLLMSPLQDCQAQVRLRNNSKSKTLLTINPRPVQVKSRVKAIRLQLPILPLGKAIRLNPEGEAEDQTLSKELVPHIHDLRK